MWAQSIGCQVGRCVMCVQRVQVERCIVTSVTMSLATRGNVNCLCAARLYRNFTELHPSINEKKQ